MSILEYKIFVDLSYKDRERLHLKDCSEFKEVEDNLSEDELNFINKEKWKGNITVFQRLVSCPDEIWNNFDEIDERFVKVTKLVVTVKEMAERLKRVVKKEKEYFV